MLLERPWMRRLKLGKPLKHRQALVARTSLDNVKAMAVTKQVPDKPLLLERPWMRRLKLGKPLKHKQALVARTTLDNVKAMAVTKQVPHLRWSQAPPLPCQGRGRRIFNPHLFHYSIFSGETLFFHGEIRRSAPGDRETYRAAGYRSHHLQLLQALQAIRSMPRMFFSGWWTGWWDDDVF